MLNLTPSTKVYSFDSPNHLFFEDIRQTTPLPINSHESGRRVELGRLFAE